MVERKLSDSLKEIMALATKYDFSMEDGLALLDRCLLLGEACSFLEDLGLMEELKKRHIEMCKKAMELASKI